MSRWAILARRSSEKSGACVRRTAPTLSVAVSGQRARSADEHERAHVVHRPPHEEPKVATVIDQRAHEADGLRRVVRRDRIEQRARLFPVRRAEQLVDIADPDLALGEGRDLIEDALGVAERALRMARDRLEGRGLDRPLLALGDRGELLDHLLVRDPAQIEALRP